MAKKKELKTAIEDEIREMLEKKDEPNEQRMKLLKLGIGFLAVQAKLEESEYGGFFGEGEQESEGTGRGKKRKEPGAGGNERAADYAAGGSLFDAGDGAGLN